ncbi:enoyl-CoA hydratase, partial [Neisseria gonorrhoeae]
MLNHPTVKYRTEQAIAIVTIDRYDEARNAVNPETAQGLAQAFRAFDRDPSLSVAIL